MSGFFEEVKRRKVYRVAVAYVIAAGGIIQIASAVFPAWDLPAWSLRLVIVLLLIGFPIGLILAWAYDLTPEGVRVTDSATSFPSRRRGRKNLFILLAIGVLVSSLAGFFVLPRALARKMDKSIAVLPFENLSDDKSNAFFADGIQDDILTNLAKIGDLKVISRTSVMGYREKTSSVREIGKTLGVSAILEGSVRTDPKTNRVRVNVQLINAENDQHLWAEDYDRDLTDVFAIQTDLAQKIANELQAKLSASEKAQLMRKPTENGEAYLAFVQAQDLFSQYVEDIEKLNQAERLFERALQLDPNFALAAARYSHLESWIYHTWSTPGTREKARTLAKRALDLQPDLPEGHLARGYSYYYGDSNFDAALSEFETAQRGLPNDMGTYLALGAIKRRQGRWAESNADFGKAAALSPNSSWALQNLAFNYEMLRDFGKANATLERALAISPRSFALWEIKAQLAMLEHGDLSVIEKAIQELEKMPESRERQQYLPLAQAQCYLLQRKWTEALAAAQNAPSEDTPQGMPEHMVGRSMLIGLAQKGLGNETEARIAFTKAKDTAEAQLRSLPDNAGVHSQIALALAFLGDKEGALAEAKRAMEILPESKDAFEGPNITESAAQVHCIVGEHARAIEMLDGLLSRPAALTAEMLKINPAWDALRNEPGFQQLLAKHGAKT